jgi:hypothetical protein
MDAITLTIPSDLVEELHIPDDPDELRQALLLGLTQLRQQQAAKDAANSVIQALLSTGRVRHLSAAPVESADQEADRQAPPTLPGPPVSEILVAQRRGEL